MDELARLNGFESAVEMNKLIAAVDISTPEKLQAFNTWKEGDGSKAGLQQLLPKSASEMVGYIYLDTDKLTPEDVIKMPLREFYHRFGFMPDDAAEKKWFAVIGKRLDSIGRGVLDAGVLGENDLSNVNMNMD